MGVPYNEVSIDPKASNTRVGIMALNQHLNMMSLFKRCSESNQQL